MEPIENQCFNQLESAGQGLRVGGNHQDSFGGGKAGAHRLATDASRHIQQKKGVARQVEHDPTQGGLGIIGIIGQVVLGE